VLGLLVHILLWTRSGAIPYTNMEEVIPYFEKFDKIYWKRSEQPTLKQLDHMPKLHKVVPHTCTPFSFVIVEFKYLCL
jgi:hypothetical protein